MVADSPMTGPVSDPLGTTGEPLPVDGNAFREALGRFASGVTVVTGLDGQGGPIGATVSAFSSVSLDPPLILFCLANDSATLACVTATRDCAINILAENQEAVSRAFANRTLDWDGIACTLAGNGVPLLTGCLATIEARVQAVYPGGDHCIVVAMVTRIAAHDGKPLVHHLGEYSGLTGIGP